MSEGRAKLGPQLETTLDGQDTRDSLTEHAMSTTVKRVLLVIILIAGASTAQEVVACTCQPRILGPEGVKAAVASSDLVFSGYVTSISINTGWSAQSNIDTGKDNPLADKPLPFGVDSANPRNFGDRYGIRFALPLFYKVHFEVFHVWKGQVGEEIQVRTQFGGGTCGYTFRLGESYLVYASHITDKQIAVHQCSRTSRLRGALEDISVLGPPVIDHVRGRAKILSLGSP